MGTRSITHIHEMKSLGGKIVCSFYRQFDGYPSAHGDDLSEWLKHKKLVNGISSDFVKGRDHNRAGQMAIELMHHLKQDTSIEVIPTGASDHGEEYVYSVNFDGDDFLISCECIYSGKKHLSSAVEFDGNRLESLWNPEDE